MIRVFLLAAFVVGCSSEVRIERNPAAPPEVVPPAPTSTCPFGEPTTIAQLKQPNGLALSDDHLFFTDLAGLNDCTGSVQSVPLTGGSPEVLMQGLCAPNRIVHADGMLYWLSHSGIAPDGSLTALDLGNGGLSTLIGDLIAPDALAVDGRYVYVGDDVEFKAQSPGRVIRIDRQTKEAVEIATSSGRIMDIALDDDYVYWSSFAGFGLGQDNKDSAVFRVSKLGGEKQRLADGLVGVYGIARAGTRVFVVHPDGGQILAFTAEGLDESTLVSGLLYPQDVASDGENVFATAWGPPSDLFVLRDGAAVPLTKTIGFADQVLLGADCIYWTEQSVDDALNGVVRAMPR